MPNDNKVEIKISGESSAYSKELDKVGKETEALEGQLASISKISGVAFAALTAGVVASVKAFADAEKVTNRVNQIIKATGGAAGVTSNQVFSLASRLQSVTTFGDEAIATGTGILLTFGRIGGEIIPEATEAVLDLATRLGTDTSSAAEMLGKALNNPVEGLRQLRKVGIDLTEAQEKQIKSMVAAGNVAEAQRFVLEQLKGTIGGLAREASQTTAGAFAQLRENFGDIVEEVGKNLAPALVALAKNLNAVFVYIKDHPEVTKLVAALALGGTVVSGLATFLGAATLAALKFRAAMMAAQVSANLTSVAIKGLVGATGIGLLVVLITEVALHWDTIWPRMQKVFAAFAGNVAALASNVGGVLGAAFRFDFNALKNELANLKATLAKGYEEAFAAIPERKVDEEAIGQSGQGVEAARAEYTEEIRIKKQKEDEKEELDRIAKAKELERNRQQAAILKLESEGASQDLIDLYKKEGELKMAMLETHTAEEREALQARFEQVQAMLAEQTEIEAEQRQTLRDTILAQNDEFQALTEEQQARYYERNRASLTAQIETEKTARRKFLDEKLKEQIASNNKFLDDQVRFNKSYAIINKFLRDNEVEEQAAFFGTFQRMTQSNNTILKTIGKAAAITQITIDTAKGATQALSAFPIPFIGHALGMAAATAVVGFGAEQIGRVIAAADGGLLTGGVPGMDSIPMLGMAGELVAPARSYDEVINGAIRERVAKGEVPGVVQQDAVVGGAQTVVVEIEMKGRASQLFTAQQNEDRALGISRESGR